FTAAPPEADAVFGRHVFVRGDDLDELRPAADFDETWRDLERGNLSQRWLEGIPCHQAIAVRTSLLRAHGFDPVFRLAADHELYFRLVRAGARFHNSGEVVAVYHAGGLSARSFERCVQEWVRIAVRHGRFAAARRFYSEAGLAPRQLWAAALSGWTDRLAGRRRRRFGREFSAAGSPIDFGRRSLAARALDGFVGAAARALAKLEELMPWLLEARGEGDEPSGMEPVYRARRAQGIDFRRPGRPRFVARWSGLSYNEEWGRWSDGSCVEIVLKDPLPARLRLMLDAYAYEANALHPVRLSVGESSVMLHVAGLPIQTYVAELETSGCERRLSLDIPFPTAPPPQQPGEPADRRRIGIGLQSLRFIDRRS
ncbi:MAG: DUF7024 domain-containing protein, partial [Candidatus Binatia bacterium]